MTTKTVFGTNPPPGAYQTYNDGSPSIRLAQRFYRYGGLVSNDFKIAGVRLWLPSAPAGATQIRFMTWANDTPIHLDPVQSVVVDIVGTGWQEGRFATPLALPADGVNFRVGYEFVGNDDNYVFTNGLRGDAEDLSIPASPVNGLALSELRSLFRIGPAEEQSGNSYAIGYGIDVIVEDAPVVPVEPENVIPTINTGANRSIYLGQSTTLTATAADSDGTVASIEWFQVSGVPTPLVGTGASRTVTPSVVGSYVFAATATDDDGAVSAPDPVTVTVLAVPVEEPEVPPAAPVEGLKPFPMVERAVKELLEQKMAVSPTLVGGDLSYDSSVDDFYVWLGLVSGQSTEVDGRWVIDIDVFDNHYSQAMDRALAIEAMLLRRGGHRTSVMILDNVSQNEGPVERPWEDDSAYRIGASYSFTARRTSGTPAILPVAPPQAGTVEPVDLPALDVDPVLMFENALI